MFVLLHPDRILGLLHPCFCTPNKSKRKRITTFELGMLTVVVKDELIHRKF